MERVDELWSHHSKESHVRQVYSTDRQILKQAANRQILKLLFVFACCAILHLQQDRAGAVPILAAYIRDKERKI